MAATCSIAAFHTPWRQSCPTIPASYRLHSVFLKGATLSWPRHKSFLSTAWRRLGKLPRRKTLVSASLLGVGAPEIIVIAVVALLVFGPKGLAEVARSLGQSLRAFQPTIRELQSVSRDFKQTLEKEIGLDELTNVGTPNSNNGNLQKQTNDNSVIEELTTQLQILQEERISRESQAKIEAPKNEAEAKPTSEPEQEAEVPKIETDGIQNVEAAKTTSANKD